ncbi:YgfZ/GcvT domain-containing protein [Janibacter alittae]|uniref:Folate-binding protein n=1 Tax=Janibacter alittae TaxID=3115209 RepID=A0ABZ2MI08_9MICO
MTASPLLQTSGAVVGEGLDAGVAAHYGDPMREQRLLAEGLAVVDLSHRGVVTVSGPDRLSWLHSLTSQQLTDLPPRTSVESLVLTSKGKVEHALHVVDDGERTWLSVEPGTAPDLAGWLDSMRFMLRVEVEDASDRYAVLGESVDREGGEGEPPTWLDSWPRVVGDTAIYGPPAEEHPGRVRRWREVIVPVEEMTAAVGDRELAGTWAAEALRVAAWRPRLGAETDQRTIAHEVDWLRTAVHLHKGCYRGQETVAKVHNLGRPPRRLAFLHLDGSGHVLPDAGAEIRLGEKVVGHVTTRARHHEDGPIALAMLKRNTDSAADLIVDGDIAAAQTEIVPR